MRFTRKMPFAHSGQFPRALNRARVVSLLLLCFAFCLTPVSAQTPQGGALYGFVVDNSGSLRTDLDTVIAATGTLIEGTGEQSESFVIRFVDSDNIHLLHDFTRSKARLRRSLDEMYVEGGETAITDALYVAAEHLSKKAAGDNPAGTRALILVTDGEDARSSYKLDALVPMLREKKITVHVLGLPYLVRKNRGKKAYEKAVAYLNRLAQETGGRAILAASGAELPSAAAELLKVLNSQ